MIEVTKSDPEFVNAFLKEQILHVHLEKLFCQLILTDDINRVYIDQ